MLRNEIDRLYYKCKPTEQEKERLFLEEYSLPLTKERNELDGQNESELCRPTT